MKLTFPVGLDMNWAASASYFTDFYTNQHLLLDSKKAATALGQWMLF